MMRFAVSETVRRAGDAVDNDNDPLSEDVELCGDGGAIVEAADVSEW